MVIIGSPNAPVGTPWSLWVTTELAWALGARVEIIWARGPKTYAKFGMKPTRERKRKKTNKKFILGVFVRAGIELALQEW